MVSQVWSLASTDSVELRSFTFSVQGFESCITYKYLYASMQGGHGLPETDSLGIKETLISLPPTRGKRRKTTGPLFEMCARTHSVVCSPSV